MKNNQGFKLEPLVLRRNDPKPGAEEFFTLPRAEFLEGDKPEELASQIRNHRLSLNDRFSLRVSDNRMAGAGIAKGDLVVIQLVDQFVDGDVVLVRVGHRLMIRRYYNNKSQIRFECDTPGRQTMIIHKDTPGFLIVGRIDQVIREL